MSDRSSSEETWIQWFCSLEGHDFFCEVDPRYIEDNFNLYGLRQVIPSFRDALEVVLDTVPSDSEDDDYDARLFQPAVDLYGMVHARYLLTARGLDIMADKFKHGEFGTCPRHLCGGQPVLPIGLSDKLRAEIVRVFCPRCQDVYAPNPALVGDTVDGAYFGPTFPHLLLLTRPDLVPRGTDAVFEPRIFGFRVHDTAASVQQLDLPDGQRVPVAAAAAAQAKARAEHLQQRVQEIAAGGASAGAGAARASDSGSEAGQVTPAAEDGVGGAHTQPAAPAEAASGAAASRKRPALDA